MESDQVTYPGSLKFAGDLELDFRAFELRRGGRALKLERIPMELLLLLVERRGDLVTRDQIVERIWGKGVFLDTDNSINAAIRKIRQVLKDDPDQPRFVQTVTGRGYRFIAPIEAPAPIAPAEPVPEPALTSGNLIGQKISHYRVLNLIGGGGMGVVYLAEDLKLGRRVALKFLPTELATDSTAYRRLQTEARAASSLDHPNICAIYELDEHEGQPFIAMQYIEGQTLREWIEARTHNRGPLPMEEVLDLAIQIASGLEAAHQKGIVHRDIKPANILITTRGQAKILDFGVAKFVDVADHPPSATSVEHSDLTLTRTGITVGTPSYASPEQIRGEKLDGRADLFSLGLVLYEMATGEKAFEGNTAAAIRDAVLNREVVPIRQINPQLCPGLEKLILRALEKDRERRYQSAAELLADAQRLRTTYTKPSKPRITAPLAVALAAILLIAAGVYIFATHPNLRLPASLALKSPAGYRPSIAVVGFRNLSGRKDDDWLSAALSGMLATELAAGQHVRVLPDENVARMNADLSLPAAETYGRQTLQKIRNHSNADLVLLGSYFSTGNDSDSRIRFDLRLQDTHSGDTILVNSENGTEQDLAELVSRAGSSVRRSLGIETPTSDDNAAVRASMPSNQAALRLYVEGLSKLRSYDAPGARSLLEQAIAADPNHALSYSALAQAFSALGYDKKAVDEAKRAFDLSSNLPRADRFMVEGRYRELAHDYPAAIEIYRTLRNFFPDDIEYGLRLAQAQGRASLAKDELETINRMRALPAPLNQDPRIDLTEAHLDESLGDFKRAQQLAIDAATKGRQQGNRLIVAQAKEREGWAWNELGYHDKAIAAYEEARQIAAETNNPFDVAVIVLGIGGAQFDMGQYAQAEKSMKEALAGFRQTGAQQKIAYTMSELGSLYYEQAKLPQAKQYLEEALRIDTEIENGTARDLGNLANVALDMGDIQEAIKLRRASEKGFRDEGDQRDLAVTLSNLSMELFAIGDIKGAQQNVEQAIKIQQDIGNKRGLGYSMISLATILQSQDHLVDARTAAQKCIDLRTEMKDAPSIAEGQILLAQIALDQGRTAEAESLVRTALTIADEQKLVDVQVMANSTLANVLVAEGNWQDAQSAAGRATALSKQGATFESRLDAVIADAAWKSASGNHAAAILELKPALDEAKRHGHKFYELRIRLAMAQAEPQKGTQLQELHQEAKDLGFESIARQAGSFVKSETRTVAKSNH